MATKTITGAYPSGYYLNPTFETLEIASSASVGGAGVTTSTAQSSTIANFGTVQGTGNGITLSKGGTITNGVNGAPSQVASIEGATAIVANGSSATVVNYARIGSDPVVSGNTTTTGPSVVLNAGGKVANSGVDAVISNGISISGALGEVVNRSRIGGVVTYQYEDSDRHRTDFGPSIALEAGGSVNNGANGNTGASISNGVSISGGAGSIFNNGTIGGQVVTFFYRPYGDYSNTSYAIQMSGGGSVRNGTASNKSATISAGISIGGGAGSIDNQGTIAVARRGAQYAIEMSDGGSIVNGRASNASAVIAGFTQGISLKGQGSIQNFGTISANQNAVVFRSSNDTLIEEGTGVLDGNVIGGGGTLILAGDAGAGSISRIGRAISGFGHITVAAKATWTLTGSTLVEGGTSANGQIPTVFDNQGNLSTSVSFANNGFFENEGTFTAGNVSNKGSFDLYGTTTVGKLSNGVSGYIFLYHDAPLTAQRIVNSGQITTIAPSSYSTINSSILNLGSISGSFKIEGNITGSGGTLSIRRNETMELNGTVAAGQRVSFLDPQGTLTLDQSSAFRAVISGFTHGDRMDLADVPRAGATLSFAENNSHTGGVLTVTSSKTKVALTFQGNYIASRFRLQTDDTGKAEIAYSAAPTASNSSSMSAQAHAFAQSLFDAAFETSGVDAARALHPASPFAVALAGANEIHSLGPMPHVL